MPSVTSETATLTEAPATGSGTGRELFLGLLWLGTSMWTAHATINGTGADASGAFGAAAAALPGVVAATILTGATIGHAAASRFRGMGGRLVAGLALGMIFGAASAAGIRFGYGEQPSINVLALTVGTASILGGVLAVLPDAVLESGLWATSWVFFCGVIFGVLQPQLTKLLSGDSLTLAESVVTGLLAGYFALQWLRNEKTWLIFPLAGTLPGLVLLATEGLLRLGGAGLVRLVNGYSPKQDAVVQLTDAARLKHGLIVLVAGIAVTAVIGAARVRAAAR
jgi:hypothetical protein